MPRLFVEVDADEADRASLGRDGVRHLRALRLGEGDRFEAIVAPGRVRLALVERISSSGAELRLEDDVAVAGVDPARELVLAVALADLARFDVVIEKATELGATAIRTFRATRSQIERVSPSRLERWRRLARAACEQCGRTREPTIQEATTLESLLGELAGSSALVALRRDGERSWPGAADSRAPVVLVVGPEGGLTAEEEALLDRHGARSLSLGPRVLRFETAAIAALAIAAVAP